MQVVGKSGRETYKRTSEKPRQTGSRDLITQCSQSFLQAQTNKEHCIKHFFSPQHFPICETKFPSLFCSDFRLRFPDCIMIIIAIFRCQSAFCNRGQIQGNYNSCVMTVCSLDLKTRHLPLFLPLDQKGSSLSKAPTILGFFGILVSFDVKSAIKSLLQANNSVNITS